MSGRTLLLRSTGATMLVCAGLLLSLRFASAAYAEPGDCSVQCYNGFCSAEPGPSEVCTCGCDWKTGVAHCSCKVPVKPHTGG